MAFLCWLVGWLLLYYSRWCRRQQKALSATPSLVIGRRTLRTHPSGNGPHQDRQREQLNRNERSCKRDRPVSPGRRTGCSLSTVQVPGTPIEFGLPHSGCCFKRGDIPDQSITFRYIFAKQSCDGGVLPSDEITVLRHAETPRFSPRRSLSRPIEIITASSSTDSESSSILPSQ